MKILHIYKTYYPESLGGVEQTIHSLSKELAKKNIISDVISTTDKNTAYVHQAEYNRVYFYPRTIDRFSCPMSVALLHHFRKIAMQYDILHYHFPWPFADFMHLFRSVDKPSLLTYHSDIVRQKTLNKIYQPLMHRFLKKIDCIVTTSNNLLQSSPVLNKFKKKTHVAPIGLEAAQLPENQQELLNAWQNKLKQPFFLFIGVLRYYKGLDFLIEAVRDTNISVVIAGAGPEENHLHQLAQKYQLKNVTFVGKITDADKWALLKLCYGVVVPSHLRTEAFCISLLEGLMHSKPLISTELGTGTSFVNTHDVSGIIIPPGDPAALKQAMNKLLNDKPYYEKLERGALEHYNKFFTARHMGESYLNLYQSLLG